MFTKLDVYGFILGSVIFFQVYGQQYSVMIYEITVCSVSAFC